MFLNLGCPKTTFRSQVINQPASHTDNKGHPNAKQLHCLCAKKILKLFLTNVQRTPAEALLINNLLLCSSRAPSSYFCSVLCRLTGQLVLQGSCPFPWPQHTAQQPFPLLFQAPQGDLWHFFALLVIQHSATLFVETSLFKWIFMWFSVCPLVQQQEATAKSLAPSALPHLTTYLYTMTRSLGALRQD